MTIKQVVDAGLLKVDTCGAPCLLGIQPESTSYADAMSMLSKNHDMDYCKEYSNEGGVQGIRCDNSFVIAFDSDKKFVTSLGYNTASGITVQNVLDKFGDPTNLDVAAELSKDTSVLRFFYEKLKMTISFEEQAGITYALSPTNKARAVTYAGTKTYQAITVHAQHYAGFGKYGQ